MAEFFVSPDTGDDSATGLREAPWKTLSRASQQDLRPGDTIYLSPDSPHHGKLHIVASGTSELPITITSASETISAVIEADRGDCAIAVQDVSHLRISNITVAGNGGGDGIAIWSDTASCSNVAVEGVHVGNAHVGISAGGTPTYPLTNFTISDCHIENCLRDGILIYGDGSSNRPNRNIEICNTSVVGTSGIEKWTDRNSGSGIVVGQSSGVHIHGCVASGNGYLCRASEGPCGIWVYQCSSVLIEDSISIGNRTGGPADGTGFDLDNGVTEATISHCLAYGNDGAGIMLWNGYEKDSHHNHTISHNRLIENCAAISWHGEISVSPFVDGAVISQNWISPRSGRDSIRVATSASNILMKNNDIRGDNPPTYFEKVP